MGMVYRACHIETGSIVALKTVRRSASSLLAGIRREIHALARLEHPGLIRILEHGIENEIPWYAMPEIEGITLRQLLQKGPIPESKWLPLIQKLCHALAFLHGEG